jgi:hypothetical protein
LPHQVEVATDQRLFLRPRPAFDLTLDTNSIGDIREVLGQAPLQPDAG